MRPSAALPNSRAPAETWWQHSDNGEAKRDVVYANGATIAEIDGEGNIYELHCDHLGSPSHVTDGAPGSPALGQIIGEQTFGDSGTCAGALCGYT
jgi:hypothetical protein